MDDGPADDFPETLVPPGHVFLMGDNRDDSLDGPKFRHLREALGWVPMAQLIGRASFTFWSTDGSASYFEALDMVLGASRLARRQWL